MAARAAPDRAEGGGRDDTPPAGDGGLRRTKRREAADQAPSVESTPTARNRVLALEWRAGDDGDLGQLADGYSVSNAGTGLATSPFGVVFTPNAVATSGVREVELDLDGTGLATSPLGFSGKNLFTAVQPSTTLGLGVDGGVMVLADSALVGASADADSLTITALLDGGGYRTSEGFEAASLLAGSVAAAVGLTAAGPRCATARSDVDAPHVLSRLFDPHRIAPDPGRGLRRLRPVRSRRRGRRGRHRPLSRWVRARGRRLRLQRGGGAGRG